MFRTLFPALAAVIMLTAALPASAQMSFGHATVATVTASASPQKVTRGAHGTLRVTLNISPGYHVNAHALTDPDLIPTVLTPAPAPGVTWGAVRYPAARTLPVAGKPAPVYTGRTTLAVPFTVTKRAKPGPLSLSATLSYQGCNASACFPPVTAPVKSTVSVR